MGKHSNHQNQTENHEQHSEAENRVVKAELKVQPENTPKNFSDIFMKEILARAQGIDQCLLQMKKQLVKMIQAKSEALAQKIPEELRQKMCEKVNDEKQTKQFICKYCYKGFSDGRQLGGHTSRAHPQLKKKQKIQTKRKKNSKKEAVPKFKSIKKSFKLSFLKEQPQEGIKSQNNMQEENFESSLQIKPLCKEDPEIYEQND